MTDEFRDYYEVLQVSANADQDMIHRVYRLLAQRFHPDNPETGSIGRFQELQDAYAVLSDPPQRAKYDVAYHAAKKDRLRLVTTAGHLDNDFELEQALRLTVLEALYTQRRVDAVNPGIFDLDFEALTGATREHLEFTFWYLVSKGLVKRGDSSKLVITVDGVDYLEQQLRATGLKRLTAPESTLNR